MDSKLLTAILMLTATSVAHATPRIPPLSSATLAGHWEGFCTHADQYGFYTFAVQLEIDQALKGAMTVGRLFGRDLLQDRLDIQRVIVNRGSVTIRASEGQQRLWKGLRFRGAGVGFDEGGWLRGSLALTETAYKCDVTLFKKHPTEGVGYFEHVRRLLVRLGFVPAATAVELTPLRQTAGENHGD
jgi:hypothetical protein